MSEATTLVEQLADWHSGSHIRRGERRVVNVALAGAESKNGYRYTEAALREGARLYERKPVFLDHAPDRRRPHERSTRDLVGSVTNARYEGGRIRGDIEVLDTPAGQTFLSLVEGNTPGVGMSHVVLAERGADGATVERIHDVISVDAVIGPATTMTFRESISQEEGGRAAAGSDEEAADECLQLQLEALRRERDALAAQLAEIERERAQEGRRLAVRACIERSGLPDYAVTPVFVEQLAAADEAGRVRLIAERRELIARAGSMRPLSVERRPSETGSADAAFVAAIRGVRAAVRLRG